MADELFHHCILKWMVQRGLLVYHFNSPYVEKFLERHVPHQPELLCKYFQHRCRWAEACDAYLALAQGVPRNSAGVVDDTVYRQVPSTKDQILLLQAAALCAQMPGSNRRAEPIRQAMSALGDMAKQAELEVHEGGLAMPLEPAMRRCGSDVASLR